MPEEPENQDQKTPTSQSQQTEEPLGSLASEVSNQAPDQPTPPEVSLPTQPTASEATNLGQEQGVDNTANVSSVDQTQINVPTQPEPVLAEPETQNQSPPVVGPEMPSVSDVTESGNLAETPKIGEEMTPPTQPQDLSPTFSQSTPEPSWPPIPTAASASVFTQDKEPAVIQTIPTQQTSKKTPIILIILGLFIIIAAIGLGILFFNRFQNQNLENSAPAQTTLPPSPQTETPQTGPENSVFGDLLNPGSQSPSEPTPNP